LLLLATTLRVALGLAPNGSEKRDRPQHVILWAATGIRLWHKDREVVTYSYGLPWARVIAVP
jgi:hypothetical protein